MIQKKNNIVKKEYDSPCIKVVELKQQSALLQCSAGGVEKTPGICGPIGMTPFDDSHESV